MQIDEWIDRCCQWNSLIVGCNRPQNASIHMISCVLSVRVFSQILSFALCFFHGVAAFCNSSISDLTKWCILTFPMGQRMQQDVCCQSECSLHPLEGGWVDSGSPLEGGSCDCCRGNSGLPAGNREHHAGACDDNRSELCVGVCVWLGMYGL